MSTQPAVELPAELEPQLQFDSEGTPLVYDLGQQLIRDRKLVHSYIDDQPSAWRTVRNIFYSLMFLSPIIALIVAVGSGQGPFRVAFTVFLGILVGLFVATLGVAMEGGVYASADGWISEIARRRRVQFRVWAEDSLKTAQSEKELDELQNRMGALRIEQERRASSQAEPQLTSGSAQRRGSVAAESYGTLPYWMGGPAPEAQKAPEKPKTIDKPVMS